MAQHTTLVTVKFSKLGTLPPVYLAGSFSDPAWQPQEMQYTIDENNEYEYHKEVEVEEGKQYQYKFRVGQGDWWVLNESAPTVTDDIGNRNNLLEIPAHSEIATDNSKAAKAEGSNAEASLESLSGEETLRSLHVEHTKEESKPGVERTGGKTIELEESTLPTLAFENVDSEPRHGDGFEKNSTVGEKDAHQLRAQDAEPDLVVLRKDSHTPELANVAAEVADSVLECGLDRSTPTPPISDEEAGRIGFRRMSATPIPEVAETAAEVSDSAAKLDRDNIPQIQIPPISTISDDEKESTGSGTVTPWEERAPLFAHECMEPPTREEPIYRKSPQPSKSVEEAIIDPNDPNVEEFPSERFSILEHVRTVGTRLSEDQTSFEGIPPSPIVNANLHPENAEFSTPSPHTLDQQRSPSLDSIPEEQADREEAIQSLPSAKSLVENRDVPTLADLGDDGETGGQNNNRIPLSVGVAVVNSDLAKIDSDGSNPSITAPIPTAHIAVSIPTTVQSITPSVIDKRKLGEEDAQKSSTDEVHPNIMVIPATPGSSTKTRTLNSFSKSVDSAQTTAIEEEDEAQVKSRKRQPSPVPARPITPTSMRSAGKDARSKNFLKAFWRVVFVDWIGGLIVRLCGGNRHT
ncbi:hypothetical protein B7494_g8271 [Chlorociboria aeruginascens]|nr:hypothetical protein B7494_g8271 [Chlorociboria aeruginascens]